MNKEVEQLLAETLERHNEYIESQSDKIAMNNSALGVHEEGAYGQYLKTLDEIKFLARLAEAYIYVGYDKWMASLELMAFIPMGKKPIFSALNRSEMRRVELLNDFSKKRINKQIGGK